ncbi:MAG: hypothetical protein JSV62_04125 [Promethearchaeota archaeon]|nr:MAG: hypothetical protein JSV62_04125 [Candidatus Lokiarchaeota archaeon]
MIRSSGLKTAKIAIIAACPSSEEERKGKPFVGYIGNLLNQVLLNAEINRKDVYITYLSKTYEPSFLKPIKKVLESKKFLEDKEELIKELHINGETKVIVPLDNIVLYALSNELSVDKWRGSILFNKELNKKIIPTYHPRQAIKMFNYSYIMCQDFKRIKEEIETEYSLPKRNIKVYPTAKEAINYIETIPKIISYDIEVINNAVASIAIAKSPGDIMCIPFIKGNILNTENYFTENEELAIWTAIKEKFESYEYKKIAHNIIFDSTYLLEKYGIEINNIGCTLIAMAIALPGFPLKLPFGSSIFTKEPYFKDEGKLWKSSTIFNNGLGKEEADKFWVYNAKDAAVCLEMYPKLTEIIENENNVKTYESKLNIIKALSYMQLRGISIDIHKLNGIKKELKEKIEELKIDFKKLAPAININSFEQLVRFFYFDKKYKPIMNPKNKGSYSVDIKALKKLAKKGSKEASILLEYRGKEKLFNTYFNMKLSFDNRIHSSFNPVGAVTGRLSSSKCITGIGANLQNLPPTFQLVVKADNNYTMYICDYSQAELRIVAYVAPEWSMIEALESGRDIHIDTGSLIFGIPYDQVSREPGSCSLGDGTKSQRDWSKTANFGLIYIMSPQGFARNYECSIADATMIVNNFYKARPGIVEYHNWISYKIKVGKPIINLLGRSRKFAGRHNEILRKAVNQIPQSSVGDLIDSRGLYYISKNLPNVELLNQVHDSIIIQINNKFEFKQHIEWLKEIKKSLEQPCIWKDKEFIIPAGFHVCKNMKEKKEILLNNDSFSKDLETIMEIQ